MLPFALPGRFWRGNLHCHSDRSDGALSPEDVCLRYREAGYDFTAVTDHFRPEYGFPVTDTTGVRDGGFTTLIGAELDAPRTEFASKWHIVAVGLPLDFTPPDPRENAPALARRARAAGAFIGMAHPAAGLLTAEDAAALDAAHAVEIYNSLAAREDRGDSQHLYDVLLGRGRRLDAYVADDAHFQPQDPPGLDAWVQVRSESLDPAELLDALKAGNYYSSTGPEIHDIEISGGKITVRCTPARKVVVVGSVPGAQWRGGDGITYCTLPLDMFERSDYVRVIVTDTEGNRAWSNPVWP